MAHRRNEKNPYGSRIYGRGRHQGDRLHQRSVVTRDNYKLNKNAERHQKYNKPTWGKSTETYYHEDPCENESFNKRGHIPGREGRIHRTVEGRGHLSHHHKQNIERHIESASNSIHSEHLHGFENYSSRHSVGNPENEYRRLSEGVDPSSHTQKHRKRSTHQEKDIYFATNVYNSDSRDTFEHANYINQHSWNTQGPGGVNTMTGITHYHDTVEASERIHHSKRESDSRSFHRLLTDSVTSSYEEEFDNPSELRNPHAATRQPWPHGTDKKMLHEGHVSAMVREPLIKETPFPDNSDIFRDYLCDDPGGIHFTNVLLEDTIPRKKVGLLRTPSLSPEADYTQDDAWLPDIPYTENNHAKVMSAGLLPTPTESQFPQTLHHEDTPQHSSTGLLPTPTISPEETSEDKSTDFLWAQKLDAIISSEHSVSHVKTSTACSPFDNSIHTSMVESQREVQRVIYPSRELLPTPKGTPEKCFSCQSFKQNVNFSEDSEIFPENIEQAKSVNTLSLGSRIDSSCKDNTEMETNIETTGSELKFIPKQDSFFQSQTPAPVKVRAEENKPKANKLDSYSQFTEKQIIETTQVQIKFARALEDVQKTMQTLQKKIHQSQCCEKAKNKIIEKDRSLRKENNDASNARDDTNIAELGGELDDIAIDTLNKVSENDKISVKVPSVFKEKTESLQILKTRTDNEKKEEELAREDLPAMECTEECESNDKLYCEYVNESCKQKASKSTGKVEYKTYKEWRLARQRMNEYFYHRNPNSEGFVENDNGRNRYFKVKHKDKRNDVRSPNSSNQELVSETKYLNNIRNKPQVDALNSRYVGHKKSQKLCDFQNPISDPEAVSDIGRCLGDKSPSGVSSGSRDDMVVPDRCFEDSMQDKLDSLGRAGIHIEHTEESSQESKTNEDSNQSIKHEQLKQEISDDVTELSRKHFSNFNWADKTEVKQSRISSVGIDLKEKRENSQRERKQNDKEEFQSVKKNYGDDILDKNKKHRDSHSSDSLSKQHSRDRSNSEGQHSDRLGNCTSSRSSKSHRHPHQQHHHEKFNHSPREKCRSSTSREKDRSLTPREMDRSSISKEKEQNLFDFITNSSERGRKCSDTLKTNESEVKNKPVQIRKIHCEQSQKTYEHKYDTNEKGNLFEKMALNNEIVDVVGGLSTDEENDKTSTKLDPQIGVMERNLKTSLVKLFDISQSKRKVKTNLLTAKKENESSKKKNLESIFSLKDDDHSTKKKRSRCQKDGFHLDSLSNAQSVKISLVESEDSSTEVDPFEKMRNFIYKDKKNTSLNLTDSKVQSSSFQKKSKKRLDDFIVSDSHVSDLENSNSSLNFNTDRSPQCFKSCSEKSGKKYVKHLKRVNNILYWKKIKILFPRIKLKRLNRADIQRFKKKLKENILDIGLQVKGKPVNSNKNVFEGLKEQKHDANIVKLNLKNSAETEIVGSETVKGRKVYVENKSNQDNRYRLKEFSVLLNKCAISEYAKLETASGSKSVNKNLSDNTKNSSSTTSTAPVSDECKHTNYHSNFKRYKRIMTVPCSATEHSDSSDIERIVCVSHHKKLRPVISDSDQSDELEGSLGSEDSTCLDLIDESDEDKSEGTKGGNTLILVKSEFQVLNTYQPTKNKHDTETFPSDKDNLLPSLEIEKQTDRLVTEEIYREIGGKKEGKESETSLYPVSKQQIKRNIFTDLSNECSATSGTESVSSVSLEQIKDRTPNEQTLMRNSLSLAKVTASLGKTLKTLKVENSHALSSEESGGPEFICLPERKAFFKRENLNETIQLDSSVSVCNSLDEVHRIENNEILPGQQTPGESENPERNLEKSKTDLYKKTCSVSACEFVKRHRFDGSSSDSSEDEHLLKSLSKRKYKKGQSEENVIKESTKDENKEKQKESSTKDSESRKHLPFKAKKLFKSTSQVKKQATIMQMDGNADLILGPPDESSGEEGDVEDNVTCINVDSDNENGSQDLKEEVQGKDLSSINCKETVIMKGVTNKDNSAYVVDRENGVSKIDNEKSDDDDDEKQDILAVKNEPDWLKFGYTQELETIFLSDDDEMVMSVSQPVILVSDEETQDPDATPDLVLENIKQEKDDIENDGMIDATYETYSIAEDWSDRGSDFEPEKMFNSLKAYKSYAGVVESDHNDSDCSLFSDNEMSNKSQSLLEPKSTCTKNDGFESSDGAIMSVNEDELLGSPIRDETTSLSNFNEEDLLGITNLKAKVWQKTDVSITEKENRKNKDFSSNSDSDEILFKSTLEVENWLRKGSTINAEQVSDVEKDTDVEQDKGMIESSQRFEPVTQKNKIIPVNKSIKCKEDSKFTKSRWKAEQREINKQKNTSTRKSQEKGQTDKDCEALYLQDTQVDQDVSEDTSNSLTAFDFFSEYFPESDTDSKLSAESETGKSSSKLFSWKKYEDETLSDNSDIMILDNYTKDEKIKAHPFLNEEQGVSKRNVRQPQSRDGISELRGTVQDEYFGQTQTKFTQLENTVPDMYFKATQAEKPKCSFDTQIKELRGTVQDKYFGQTQTKFTQFEKTMPDVYFTATQVEKPKCSFDTHIKELRGTVQDKYFGQTQTKFTQFEKTMPDIYFTATRVEKPKCSFDTQIQEENSETKSNDTQTQAETPEPYVYDIPTQIDTGVSAYEIETQVDDDDSSVFDQQVKVDMHVTECASEQTAEDSTKSSLYYEQTQIDRPSINVSLKKGSDEADHSDVSDDSYEDPQLQTYYQNAPFDKNTSEKKRFSCNLGIIFDSFSHSSDEDIGNKYDILTQVDTIIPEHNESVERRSNSDLKVIIKAEKTKSVKKGDSSVYNEFTEAVSLAESEDDEYGAMTQLDPAIKRKTKAEKTKSVKKGDSSVYNEFTEAVSLAESEDDEYGAMTQLDPAIKRKTKAEKTKSVKKGDSSVYNEFTEAVSLAESEDDEYGAMTQLDPAIKRKTKTEKTKSVKKGDSSVYNEFTEAVPLAESEDDEYGAMTQVDQAIKRKTIDEVGKKDQPLMPPDGSTHFAATQFESISEHESETVIQNGELYDKDTQVDGKHTKQVFAGVKTMSEMSDSNENNSCIVNLKGSLAGQRKIFDLADQKKTCYLADQTYQKRSDITSTTDFRKGKKKDIYDFSDSSSNIDTLEDLHANEDDYLVATQNNLNVIDTKRIDEKEDSYYIPTKINVSNVENEISNKPTDDDRDDENDLHKTAEKKNDNSDEEFYDETLEGELPDIEPVGTDMNDIYLLATQDYTENIVSSKKQLMQPERKTSYSTEKTKQKSVQGAKKTLKRPITENSNDKTVRFGQISDSSAPKKFRVSEKKVLEIEAQKFKTVAEKRASGTMSVSSKPQISLSSVNGTNSSSDIEIIDASKSCMWLSKNVVSKKKVYSRVREADKFGKRKRRESAGEDLRAQMMAARSQMKERSMHTVTHPDAVKRQKTGPTATVTMSELEDVTLPTNSQIIRQGLPLLNSTGIILKRNSAVRRTSENHTSEEEDTTESALELASNHVTTVSSATTTISVASSVSLPNTVMSPSAHLTSAKQQNVSGTEKKQKGVSNSNENGATGIERVEGKKDKTKPEKEKVSQKRDSRDKPKNRHSSSGKGTSKKNYDERTSEKSETVKIRTENKHKYTNKDNNEESNKISKENKDKYSNNKSKEDKRKSDESRNYKDDKRSSKEKSGKKREKEKHRSKEQRHESGQKDRNSNSKDTKQRHGSEQRRERERHSSQGHMPSETQNREKDPNQTSNIKKNIQKLSNITSTKTTSSSTVTCSSALPVVTSLVATSGEMPANVSLVNAGQSAPEVKKAVSIASTIATSTATVTVSRNTTKPISVVKTTTSTHIQSSILLQKHHGSSAASSAQVPYPVPVASTSGRQPFQPIVFNIPASAEPKPSNMVGNVQTLRKIDFLKVILKWSPNWFEERGKMEQAGKRAPPPDVTKDLFGRSNHTLFPLLERYVNYKEYSEKFMLPLLLHETWESCYSTWRERKSKQRLCQHKLMFYQQNQGGEYTFIGLILERDRFLSNHATEGDLVKVIINGDIKVSDNRQENLDYTMSGFVDKVTFCDFSVERICAHYKDMAELRKKLGECISIKLIVKVRPRIFIPNEKKIVHLESICSLVNPLRQFKALSSLPSSPLCGDLLYPTGNMTYCDTAPSIVPGLQDEYNQSQLKAISTAGKIACLPREHARVCLLQGPPGTGKSHTIVGIVKHLVKISSGRCRICLCAPSNAAIDELLGRLIKHNRTGKSLPIHLVRLGKKNSVRSDVQPYCLNNLIQKNVHIAMREEMLKQLPQSLQGERKALENKISMVTKSIENALDQFQRQKLRKDLMTLQKQKEVLEMKYVMPKKKVDPKDEKKTKSNILLKAHVIAGTLSSIGSNVLQTEFQAKSGLSFQVVIVDEATQAIELETLIPLQYGVTKLILVGDPEQLPATVLSQVATENKFNMSLFERLDSHFRYTPVNPVILLDTQYRMDPEISAFPNKYIYNGRIKDDRCVLERSQSPLVPYLLFDVSEGIELFSQGTRSMSNPLEAIFTAELCKFIVTKSTVQERVIGIIAPYANQKSEILSELQKRGLHEIEVSTVDGFQGREKHVIVMSCVRANTSGTVGFVGNRNRMNVSLTRAKYAMYLVGHFEALEASDEWKALLADAQQRCKIVPVSKVSMKQAIRKVLKEQNRDTHKKK